ncbi:MAG TPA: putative sulfate exporter family transporter [Pseudonocardiaceae bacterium]|nr:putative sulfate exporter family transporter [Pseudonocardiaceae bacterium]
MARTVDSMALDVDVPPRTQPNALLPGFGLIVLGIGLGYAVNLVLPAVSALTAAVVIGVLVNHLPFLPATTRPGLAVATRKLLRTGVVLLGLQLAVPQLLALGGGTLLAVVVTVAAGFLGTIGIGRLLGVPRGLGLMVATGFSICGASAIAAMEGVTDREDEDVATGIALVTLYGGLAIALIPVVGGWLGLHGVALGTWAGLSVHEVAQVVAAATPAGAAAVAAAVVVKLSRVVLLAPMVAAVGMAERRRQPHATGRRPPVVPLFVLGFLVTIGLRGLLPTTVLHGASTLTTLVLAGALFGLGTTVRAPALMRTGPKALLLGLCSTVLVATVAFVALRLFG